MILKPLPPSGRCCYESLTIARDATEYSFVEFRDGKWTEDAPSLDYATLPDSVRLFCPDCGEYYEVPEGLA